MLCNIIYGLSGMVYIACTPEHFHGKDSPLLERCSLASGRKDVILQTYAAEAWLAARFSSPLIILSVIAGLSLSFMMGDLWQIGCAADTVSAVARGQGRKNKAGMTSAVLATIAEDFGL